MARSAFLASVAIVVSLMITGNLGVEHHELCLGKPVNFTEVEYKALATCVKKYSTAPTIPAGATESPEQVKAQMAEAQKNKCLEPCFMNERKEIANGKVDIETAKKFINEFPEEARKPLTESYEKCAATIKDKTLSMDNDCKDYEAFIKCVDDDEDKICKRT